MAETETPASRDTSLPRLRLWQFLSRWNRRDVVTSCDRLQTETSRLRSQLC